MKSEVCLTQGSCHETYMYIIIKMFFEIRNKKLYQRVNYMYIQQRSVNVFGGATM